MSKQQSGDIVHAIVDLAADLPLGDRKEARQYLRRLALQCDMAEFFGFRIPRKARAETQDRRSPTADEIREAATMLFQDVPAHEIEARYARLGVRMTRNRLSRMGGARP
jgi:hypothetical protein